ncbi:hypothetical protein TNCV_49561 [Trichonephila clavipes]|nr:hypothetical protein TNCV_49561 [Trichonephila clavipes]
MSNTRDDDILGIRPCKTVQPHHELLVRKRACLQHAWYPKTCAAPLTVAERLAYHPSTSSAVDEVGHRLEVAWDEFSMSVIQTQFTCMSNRVRAVLVAKADSCFY